MLWKIASRPSGKAVIVFEFSDKLDPTNGLEIGFSGFEKNIPATEWHCLNGTCTTSLDIIGPVAGWFSDSPKISFAFNRDGKRSKLDASMNGFQQAMTASHNPLAGKGESTSAAAAPAKTEKTAALQ